MKITIVGHWGGYPPANGATSCYVVEKDDFCLVIDLGSGALAKLQNYYSIEEIDAVILSHYHHDHIADVGVLQYAMVVHHQLGRTDKILPIYGHQEDHVAFEQLTHDFTAGRAYDPQRVLNLGPFEIRFLKTNHPVPCYGMKIQCDNCIIIYTADSSYDENWICFAEEADLLIADCNFYANQRSDKAGHMTSIEVAKIAKKAKVKHLILSHLPPYGDPSQLIVEAKQLFTGPIDLAREGLCWERSTDS